MSPSPTISPQRILTTLQAYRDAAVLNTAIELDLFTRIAQGADTPGKVAASMGVPVHSIRVLCEYLAGAGLLEKEDEQLKLSDDAALFLDKRLPSYLGGAARILYSPELLRAFEKLGEAVRHDVNNETGGARRPQWFDLARGVSDAAGAAKAFAEMVNLPAGQPIKILDLGARDGLLGIALAVRYPNALVVALDRAEALKAAQANADAAKLGTRYQNIPGDPLVAPLGRGYDVVLLGGTLNPMGASQITSLLMRVHYALKKTGQLLILDFLPEDTPEFVRQFAAFRVNLLAATPRGDAHSLAHMKGMLESSGFTSIEARAFPPGRATMVSAKP